MSRFKLSSITKAVTEAINAAPDVDALSKSLGAPPPGAAHRGRVREPAQRDMRGLRPRAASARRGCRHRRQGARRGRPLGAPGDAPPSGARAPRALRQQRRESHPGLRRERRGRLGPAVADAAGVHAVAERSHRRRRPPALAVHHARRSFRRRARRRRAAGRRRRRPRHQRQGRLHQCRAARRR